MRRSFLVLKFVSFMAEYFLSYCGGYTFGNELAADTCRRAQTFCPADLAEQKIQSASGGIKMMFGGVQRCSLWTHLNMPEGHDNE